MVRVRVCWPMTDFVDRFRILLVGGLLIVGVLPSI